MLSVEFLPPNGWLLLNRPSYEMYGASLHLVGKEYELTIFGLLDRYQELLEINTEIYRTHFWADNPVEFVDNLLSNFCSTRLKAHPIELVYNYGGSLNGGPLRLFPKFIGSH
jgi:hypothetical protein